MILQAAGVILAALLAAFAILVRDERLRAFAVLGALALVPVLLVAHVWSTPQFEPFRDRPVLFALAAVLGGAAVLGAALWLERRPAWFPVAVAAAIPFRIPIESGGETASLLVPLYVVIGAGALAFVLPHLRRSFAEGRALAFVLPHLRRRFAEGGEEEEQEPKGKRSTERTRPALLEQLLAAAVVLYAVQATYSPDFDHALEQEVFFYVPFALLFVLLTRVRWTTYLATRCLAVLIGLGVLFAGIGFVEYATRHVLLSSNAVDANSYQSYFRVSSLFFDPNIYGRFLAVVVVLVCAVVLWSRERGRILAGAAVLFVALGGMVLSLSQSSLAALLAGLVVLAALRWGAGRTAVVVGPLAVAAVLVVLALPGASGVDFGSERSIDKTSSGRVDLVNGGLELFGDRPVWGYGSGSFEEEFRDQRKATRQRASSASHTIPVTVAAEQGVIGLLVYLGLLAAVFARLLHDAFTSMRRAAIGAALATLVLHTLVYAAFLEDPLTWALLGIGAAMAWQLQPSPRERALARAERRAARAARLPGPEPEGATALTAEPA